MSDHNEHECGRCGSYLHHTDKCQEANQIDWKVTVCDGKYTVLHFVKGGGKALRYGEEWNRDLTGDNLVFGLAAELMDVRAKLAGSEERCEKLARLVK